MAREGESTVKAETAPDPNDPRKPENPTDLEKPSIKHTIKRAIAEFNRDQVTDLAAALTYYSVLSIFPAVLAITSILTILEQPEATVEAVTTVLEEAGQSDAAENIVAIIQSISTAGGGFFALVAGIGGALWAASNYVNGFGRAMNRIYQVDEGRPIWVLRPKMLLITVILLLIAMTIIFGLVMTGPVVQAIGGAVGLADQTVMIWDIAKWPVILLLVVLAVAILYYFTPNVQQPRFRWVSVGALVAILVWIIATAGFFFYVSSFGNYNRTYGALAGVIIALLWLWLTNIALLFGAEIDAEMERSRQLQAGIKAEESIQLPPRDTRQSDKAAEKLVETIEEGRELRLRARAAGARGHKAPAAGTDDKPADDSSVDSKHSKVGESADPMSRDVYDSILEPLPSEKAHAVGYAKSGARDSEGRKEHDWAEEALERDAKAEKDRLAKEKAERSAEDSAARDSADLAPGVLEPLPSEKARRRND